MQVSHQTVRETRFRIPGMDERSLNLWVDRIGASTHERGVPHARRILGQFAAVAVESGRGLFESPSTGRQTVGCGDLLLLFPDEPHHYRGTPVWSTRWVVWNGPEAIRIAARGGLSPSAAILRGAAPLLVRTHAALQPLMAAEDFGAALERKLRILGLLAALIRHGDTRQSRQEVLDALIRDLSEGDNFPPVPELAARCRLSTAQFRRLFLRRTGRTPLAFMTALRMARARELLAAGVSMKETADRTGYGDVFHFMRVFRKTTGQTAGQFSAANRTRA